MKHIIRIQKRQRTFGVVHTWINIIALLILSIGLILNCRHDIALAKIFIIPQIIVQVFSVILNVAVILYYFNMASYFLDKLSPNYEVCHFKFKLISSFVIIIMMISSCYENFLYPLSLILEWY